MENPVIFDTDVIPSDIACEYAGMQGEYYHRIPKAGYEVEPRISLTYRALK